MKNNNNKQKKKKKEANGTDKTKKKITNEENLRMEAQQLTSRTVIIFY